MAEKARINVCGCPEHQSIHEHQDGNVLRVKHAEGGVDIYVELFEGLDRVGICQPLEATHVHSADCYAHGGVCMNQPFGVISARPR